MTDLPDVAANLADYLDTECACGHSRYVHAADGYCDAGWATGVWSQAERLIPGPEACECQEWRPHP